MVGTGSYPSNEYKRASSHTRPQIHPVNTHSSLESVRLSEKCALFHSQFSQWLSLPAWSQLKKALIYARRLRGNTLSAAVVFLTTSATAMFLWLYTTVELHAVRMETFGPSCFEIRKHGLLIWPKTSTWRLESIKTSVSFTIILSLRLKLHALDDSYQFTTHLQCSSLSFGEILGRRDLRWCNTEPDWGSRVRVLSDKSTEYCPSTCRRHFNITPWLLRWLSMMIQP